jgi:hypothetical protein
VALYVTKKVGGGEYCEAHSDKEETEDVIALECQQAGTLVVKQKKVFVIFNDV